MGINSAKLAKKNGGPGWIRTSEGISRQIYSLMRLATSLPTHSRVEILCPAPELASEWCADKVIKRTKSRPVKVYGTESYYSICKILHNRNEDQPVKGGPDLEQLF